MVETTQSSNAIMLLGIILGAIGDDSRSEMVYKPVDIEPHLGIATVESHTGNRYRITVEQVSGKQ